MERTLCGENLHFQEHTFFAEPPTPPQPRSFQDVVCEAMDHPIDLKPLTQYDLKGKKVTIIVDDWGRPTPCGEFLPDVLARLHQAGADDANITVVTASGMQAESAP